MSRQSLLAGPPAAPRPAGPPAPRLAGPPAPRLAGPPAPRLAGPPATVPGRTAAPGGSS
jgi:hypothetical protein